MLEAIKLRVNPRHDLAGRERPAAVSNETSAHLAHHATLARQGRNNRLRLTIREAAAPIFQARCRTDHLHLINPTPICRAEITGQS
jgi:hypothetical protein